MTTNTTPTAKAGPDSYVPVDLDAEVAVVAALLTTPETYDDVSQMLEVTEFGTPALATVYQAIRNCDDTGRPFTLITVANELERMRQLDAVGGRDALQRLVGRAADVRAVLDHAQIVKDKATLRRVLAAGRTITVTALDPASQADAALEAAEKTVFEIGQQRSEAFSISMPQAVAKLKEALARDPSKLLGHSTGFSELDMLTSGFQAGQLITIGARPGVGKSAFLLQIARHIAETADGHVAYLSYEMSAEELTMRMLATGLRCSLQDLRSGNVAAGRDRDVAVEVEKMAELDLEIYDNPPANVTAVVSELRRLSRRKPLAAVFIDYLQLMDGDKRAGDNRANEVAEVSKALKKLASTLGIPVVTASQLNRALESRVGDRTPRLSDLRESGSLEQDSNVVMFLSRPWTYDKGIDPRQATAILAKQRNGPSQIDIPLEWDPECASFFSGKGDAGPSRPVPPGAGAPPPPRTPVTPF